MLLTELGSLCEGPFLTLVVAGGPGQSLGCSNVVPLSTWRCVCPQPSSSPCQHSQNLHWDPPHLFKIEIRWAGEDTETVHLLVYSPKWLLGWARLKPGASFEFLTWIQGPRPLDHFQLFSQTH